MFTKKLINNLPIYFFVNLFTRCLNTITVPFFSDAFLTFEIDIITVSVYVYYCKSDYKYVTWFQDIILIFVNLVKTSFKVHSKNLSSHNVSPLHMKVFAQVFFQFIGRERHLPSAPSSSRRSALRYSTFAATGQS